MLITLFIGNGFDLNNGLQTTFTDFYDHIMIIADELSQWWEVRQIKIYKEQIIEKPIY